METCTNCGATLRPGAKFCTTCGTRLNETTTTNAGWGTPQSTNDSDSSETSVFTAVEPPAAQETAPKFGSSQRSADRWSSAYADTGTTGPSGDDPASRFISALDTEVTPTPESEDSGASDPESTWVTPPSAFTPPTPVNWSYSGGESESTSDDEDQSTEINSTPANSNWGMPSTWNTAENQAEEPADETTNEVETDEESEEATAIWSSASVTDAAGFSEGGDAEVDYLSGDENIEGSGADEIAPDAARERAIELVDELRRMVRLMGSGAETDPGAAAMALTDASLNIGEFGDLRDVLVDVKNDPRDIQALSRLAGKVDRIEALLNEHASLADAIETAIKDLTG